MEHLLRKIRVALTPRGWLLKTKLSNGAVVYGKNRAGSGGRGIYVFRDSVEPEFFHLEKFLDASGVFVDVGAAAGLYTIKAAKHYNNNGFVLAIEPWTDVLASLLHSVQANGFTNVGLRNLALGERTRRSTLWMPFDKPNASSLVKADEKASPLSVLEVALDDLFVWEGLDRLDYLKLDAPGAEQGVLSGGKETIRKYRPIVQMRSQSENPLFEFPNYSVFEASGGHRRAHSTNGTKSIYGPVNRERVYIPDEHPKVHLPAKLGWLQLS